ncbi:tyrosine-type recombinase/integrase [Hydrogenophaga atypica]|uniref:Tyrosine-type recombinase/integrase n=1 Tax=Hydrogenophaga atypica TaxID=249409 RepID=A0ABW2QUX7_9BURK
MSPSKAYVRRLGPHHFAHLRAVAEGIPVLESARRYLGIEHGHQAHSAHEETIDAVRAIARRRGESAWRLIGLTISTKAQGAAPSLDAFVAQRDLDGWSEAEVLAMYQEEFPTDLRADRRVKLRQRQIDLIQRLQAQAAETPSPTDLVNGWFDEVTAKKLIGAGIVNLGDLHARIHAGGRWYRALAGIGQTKARRIERHLNGLLPGLPRPSLTVFRLVERSKIDLSERARSDFFEAGNTKVASAPENASEGLYSRPFSEKRDLQTQNPGLAPSPSPAPLLDARSDADAVEAWIVARSGSDATAKCFRREAHRLMLWLQRERGGLDFKRMRVEDCSAYAVFLGDIPAHWISRRKASPGDIGWAPFRGQLSAASKHQALTVVSALFSWLHSARYIHGSPWALINAKEASGLTHATSETGLLDSKAFSEAAMQEVLRFVEAQAPSPARDRIRFILRFMEAVGLRSAELLSATLGDIHKEPEGWFMHVTGKGNRRRVVALPGQAFAALQRYLSERGLDGVETAPPHAPLLANVSDAMEPVTYQALYKHVRSWISKAIAQAELPAKERLKLSRASTHWLRHTFGTRGVARGVPIDVLQAQMGHSSSAITTGLYGRAPLSRRASELQKAFN